MARLLVELLIVSIICVLCTQAKIKLSSAKWTSMLIKSQGKLDSEKPFVQRDRRETSLDPDIKSMIITSKTISRYVTVQVDSRVLNRDTNDRQVRFNLQLPFTAFISNFTMLIDGELVVAEVKSKDEAKRLYEEAQERNETAGLVENDDDYYESYDDPENDMEEFSVSINVEAEATVEFTLTYQELLQRSHCLYEQVISVRPNQPVNELIIKAYVYEPQGISSFTFEEPGTDTITVYTDHSEQYKEVVYHPSLAQQTSMDAEKGIDDNFVIKYDVTHLNDGGVVQIDTSQDYFVHYFSPPDDSYTVLSKNVIFVIDISGSMSGPKMEQTRNAMQTILGQLNSNDRFMLILFDDQLEYWPSSTELVSASTSNIAAARTYCAAKLEADGGTDIYQALIKATDILKQTGRKGSNLVVFLTDGEATSGVTDTTKIIRGVSENAANKVSVFSLAFGAYADIELLSAISARTGGRAKRIYGTSNADSQLETFFEDVNYILIYDIEVDYSEVAVDTDSLTQVTFDQYFKCTELVVAGKLNSNVPSVWDLMLTGFTTVAWEMSQSVETDSAVIEVPNQYMNAYQENFIEKLYVYMKIKDILREMYITDDETSKQNLEDTALQLALQYNLVTPLTSMVIVQQDEDLYQEDYGKAYSSGSRFKCCSIWALIVSIMPLFVLNRLP